MEEEFKVEINIPKQRDGDQKVGFIVTARSQDDNRLDSVRDCIDRIEDILCGRWKVLFFHFDLTSSFPRSPKSRKNRTLMPYAPRLAQQEVHLLTSMVRRDPKPTMIQESWLKLSFMDLEFSFSKAITFDHLKSQKACVRTP